MENDFYDKVDDSPKKKKHIWPGILISVIIMIGSLAVIGPITFSVTPEELGALAFYCVNGVVLTSLIIIFKKMNIVQQIALAIGINILAIIVGFMLI